MTADAFNLALLHESPLLEDRVMCAICDASILELEDVTLVEIINANWSRLTPEEIWKLIRAAARAAVEQTKLMGADNG